MSSEPQTAQIVPVWIIYLPKKQGGNGRPDEVRRNLSYHLSKDGAVIARARNKASEIDDRLGIQFGNGKLFILEFGSEDGVAVENDAIVIEGYRAELIAEMSEAQKIALGLKE